MQRHCANCMGYKEVERAEDPEGREYIVCQNCVPLIESGEATAVGYRRMRE